MHIADQPEVIPLWPGVAPGLEGWNQQEQETFAPPPISFRTVRNVTWPTLTAFLPHSSMATGTAIIICPGGAFHSLAIGHEGIEAAPRPRQRRSTFGVGGYVSCGSKVQVPI
jgi:hypothetical protein